jgi:hypothetical protein
MSCRLTDLELSGAATLPIREAGRARPTRPLERLVSRRTTHVWESPFRERETMRHLPETATKNRYAARAMSSRSAQPSSDTWGLLK